MILHDQHVHSNYSDDSSELLENHYQKATSAGCKYFITTEHIDFNPSMSDHDWLCDFDKLIKHLNKLKKEDGTKKTGNELKKEVADKIIEIFNKSKKRYGYRRITLEINKTHKVNHKKVKRIMKQLGLFAVQGKNGKYHSYKGDNGELKENLLLEKVVDEEKHKTTFVRHFETTSPNQKWTTDVSEFKHKDGKLYLSHHSTNSVLHYL